MDSAPIACSLDGVDLATRRELLTKLLGSGSVERHELADGWSFGFPSADAPLIELVRLVELERRCCPFCGSRCTWSQRAGPFAST